MAAPTMKNLAMRQRVLKHMLESIGRYVLFQKARAANEMVDWSDPKWKVQAIFPELAEKDLTKHGSALGQVAAACASLVSQELLSRKSAITLVAAIAAKLGLEVDAEEELKTAQAEAEGRRAKQQDADSFTSPPESKEERDAALQEASDLIRAWGERADERFAELERVAAAMKGGLAPERFAEALADVFAEHAKTTGALIEALGKHAAQRQELELTLRHGKTKKRIALGDGRSYELTEEDLTNG
jgi:hypothetical protein